MSTRRNALGRGLGALLPGADEPAPFDVPTRRASPGASRPDAPDELPIDRIDPNPDQPRRVFDAAQLEELAGSIRRHGVLQPVVVRRSGVRYQLIVGERRWRAARAAGCATIPAVVADVAPGDRLELALVENVQREDLNPIELAHAFRTLAESGAKQAEIGERVGLDRSTIANHIRLLELSPEVQEDVERGRLSVGHAKALLMLENPERRRHLCDRIIRDGTTVREAERLAKELAGPAARSRSPRRATPDPELQRVIDALRQRLQTRVRVAGSAERGRIEIEYFGKEDLHRLMGLLLEGVV